MTKLRPLALCLATLATLFLAGCGDDREVGYQQVEIDEYKRQIRELEDQLYNKNAGEAHTALAQGGGTASPNNIKNAIGNGDVDVNSEKMAVRISVPGTVLFKPGSAAISGEAKATLNKIVAIIKEKFPGHEVLVVGHTDDQKVTRSKDNWDDNWDLSAGRARQVLLYLQGRGLDAKHLGLEGYGEEHPLVPNTSAANRQKNRRVEIVVIPPGGTDAK